MSDRESLTDLSPVAAARASSAYALSRGMGHIRVCIFVVLTVGIVLVSLHQTQIRHAMVGYNVPHGHNPPIATVAAHKSRSGAYSEDDGLEVWKVWDIDSSEEPRSEEEGQDNAFESHTRLAYRKLESEADESMTGIDTESISSGNGSESILSGDGSESNASGDSRESIAPGDGSESISLGSSDSSSQEVSAKDESSTVSASPSPPASANPPRPSKKKNWKDIKVEEFKPLVESVHSNIVSRRFQFVIKVLAMNNYDSLHRCLYSLAEAEYAGDEVDIHIYIDHFELTSASQRRRLFSEKDAGAGKAETTPNSKAERIKRMKERSRMKKSFTHGRMLEAESWEGEATPARLPDRVSEGVETATTSNWTSVEERLTEARRVLNHAESFYWKYGKKVIHYRTKPAGSQVQWLDAWWPSCDDEFALFLEDDAEVSPLFYRYARSLIATYYYEPSHYDRLLYGISLQRPQIVPGKNGRPLKVDDRTRLFKYQMVGIWGQIFFPRPWKEFRAWYDSKKSHNVKPVVNGLVTTDWYNQHGEKLFTPWFVKFVHSRGYFNLYTNFLRDRVLSVTHRDTGAKSKKYSGCDSVLIWENGTYDIDIWHMAASWNIKKYDFCFKEVNAGRFANYSSALEWVLYSASGGTKQLLVLSIFGVPEVLVKNWLCTLKKLGIDNYIVVGDDPELLEYLARRGHASMRFENEQGFTGNIEKEMGAVSVILGLGYSLWFVRADTIWLGNPLQLVKTEELDVIGMEDPKTSLFFIRSTSDITKLWRLLVEALSTEDTVNDTSYETWENARRKFVKECEENDQIRTSKLEQVAFLNEKEVPEIPAQEGEVSVDGKVLVLPELRSLRSYEIKQKIKPLDLWNLDGDWACSTIVC